MRALSSKSSLRLPAFVAVLAWCAYSGQGSPAKSDAAAGTFVKMSPGNGIDISINGDGREDWGFGAAFFDYNGDGRLDLFVAGARDEPGWLFKQDAGGTFHDVADTAGVRDLANGRAVKCADYDNDGDIDIYVANMRGMGGSYTGPNRLYRNNGDGTFTDVASQANPVLPSPGAPAFGAAWADYNNDGWLDLYVVNRREVPNQLFRSKGDDGTGVVTFEEVAGPLGLNDNMAGLEAVWLDYDNDGDQDLYLSQDKWGGNRLWRNDTADGVEAFTDVSLESKANVTLNPMGMAVGDYDNDGYLDIYITNTSEMTSIMNVMLHNRGDGTFENVALELGVRAVRYGWGTAFLDHDNDGDLDLYVINWSASGGDDQARNVFFRNDVRNSGVFTERSDAVGVGDTSPGYGLAVGDYNDDGYVDMFVVNNSGLGAAPGERVPFKSILYRNVPGVNRWLKVRTEGVESNRDGIGARVYAKAGALRQIREQRGGESYLCAHSPELGFGFGGVQTLDSLVVTWPSGVVDVYTDVPTNQVLTVVEGTSAPLVFSQLSAQAVTQGVDVTWDVSREAGVEGFRVYRSAPGSTDETLLNDDGLLQPSTRSYLDTSADPGRGYDYVVAAVETGGEEVRSQVASVRATPVSQPLALEQNFPNPFNPGTTISFTLDVAGDVTLAVYDGSGALVRVLASGPHQAIPYQVDWDGTNDRGQRVASGLYFYRLETPSGVLTRKMVLVK
jgi:hypothetical protein